MCRIKYEHRRNLGRYAETLFQAEAIRRGISVYLPAHNYSAVDCVVEADGRMLRVQVKSAFPSSINKRYPDCTRHVFVSSNQPFDPSRFDILACFFADKGTWLFLPSEQVQGKQGVGRMINPVRDNPDPVNWQDWGIFTTVPSVAPAPVPLPEPTPELSLA